MKKLTVILALLVTAILCFVLASCDSKQPADNQSTVGHAVAEETASVEQSTYEAESEDESEVEENHTSAKETSAQAKPSTTRKVTTTQPTTIPETTTNAPETTQAPATTVPETTLPSLTTQSESTTAIISDSEDSDYEAVIISAVNAEREAQDLPALSYSPDLSVAANLRAKEICENYGHFRPDGSLWHTVSELAMGENIAKGQATPAEVMAEWMNSEGHRNNILKKAYKTIGIGCYYDSETDTYYWVQLFGC